MNNSLKLRMAGYVLGLGQAIKESDGQSALENRIRLAAEASGQHKANDLASVSVILRHQALAERLCKMLKDFGSTKVPISGEDKGCTVNNPTCPCLPPFVDQAQRFGFSRDEARKYSCMICMPSYAQAAQALGIKFKGTLTEHGCVMRFCHKATPLTVSAGATQSK